MLQNFYIFKENNPFYIEFITIFLILFSLKLGDMYPYISQGGGHDFQELFCIKTIKNKEALS